MLSSHLSCCVFTPRLLSDIRERKAEVILITPSSIDWHFDAAGTQHQWTRRKLGGFDNKCINCTFKVTPTTATVPPLVPPYIPAAAAPFHKSGTRTNRVVAQTNEQGHTQTGTSRNHPQAVSHTLNYKRAYAFWSTALTDKAVAHEHQPRNPLVSRHRPALVPRAHTVPAVQRRGRTPASRYRPAALRRGIVGRRGRRPLEEQCYERAAIVPSRRSGGRSGGWGAGIARSGGGGRGRPSGWEWWWRSPL